MKRLSLLAVLTAAVLVLSGCAPTIPTDGPVETSEAISAPGQQYAVQPDPPEPGATSEEIVRGFIEAGHGFDDDYAVAREYLTEDAAASWNPEASTRVYSSEPEIQHEGDDTLHLQMVVSQRVDSFGAMTRPEQPDSHVFELEQVDGEWRIATPPNGSILSDDAFNGSFQYFTLYFFDPQYRYTVPDTRWFPIRPGLPAEIMRRLLEGPAPWLEEAVVSAFPDDARLASNSVPIDADSQVAEVELAASRELLATDDAQRLLMQRQLDYVLNNLQNVRSVQLSAGADFSVPNTDDVAAEDMPQVVDNPQTASTQIGILDGELAWQEEYSTYQVEGLPDLQALDPQLPATPNSGVEVFAFVDGTGGNLYHVSSGDEEPELVLEGEDLSRPSMDNFGWTWTASNVEDTAAVHAIPHGDDPNASPTQVNAQWLEDRSVTSLRISQDGTRAAVVVDDAGEQSLFIAPVVRNSAGVPRALAAPLWLDPSVDFNEVRWSDNDAVVVWQSQDPDEDLQPHSMQEIMLNGDVIDSPPSLLGLQNVSAGEGQNIYAQAPDSNFYSLVGDVWVDPDEYEVQISDYAYPG